MLKRICIAACVAVSIFLVAPLCYGASAVSAEREYYDNGVVVTASPPATRVGIEIIEAGGNAVDAAVAVGFALAVTYPRAGNIGGGGFMLIRKGNGESTFIDFREKAPYSAYEDMYLTESGDVIGGASTIGHRASGVPGTVAGLYLAHSSFGSLPWTDLLKPAIRLAEDGFIVSQQMSLSLERLMDFFKDFPSLGKFADIEGKPLEEGDLLVQPLLAETLKRISKKGRDGFYEGETARLIAEEMRRGGGLIKERDLSEYRALEREPVEGQYRGYNIISAPPPSSGGIVLIEILNILEGYPLGDYGFMTPDAIHHIIEAEKLAYRDRSQYLGDPDFVEIPVDMLLSKDYASRSRDCITDKASTLEEPCPRGAPSESEETTHYSIVDGDGWAVSVTTTLNGSYGSKVVVEGGGFLMNNEMDDFSIKQGVPNMYGLIQGKANSIKPGKRMLSSMTPTIVTKDGMLKMVLGTPGGSTIITTVAQFITDIIDFGLSPEEAQSVPRYHHQYIPDIVFCEEGAFSDKIVSALEGKGHHIKERSPIGDLQLIYFEGTEACGYPDPRNEGSSAGLHGNIR